MLHVYRRERKTVAQTWNDGRYYYYSCYKPFYKHKRLPLLFIRSVWSIGSSFTLTLANQPISIHMHRHTSIRINHFSFECWIEGDSCHTNNTLIDLNIFVSFGFFNFSHCQMQKRTISTSRQYQKIGLQNASLQIILSWKIRDKKCQKLAVCAMCSPMCSFFQMENNGELIIERKKKYGRFCAIFTHNKKSSLFSFDFARFLTATFLFHCKILALNMNCSICLWTGFVASIWKTNNNNTTNGIEENQWMHLVDATNGEVEIMQGQKKAKIKSSLLHFTRCPALDVCKWIGWVYVFDWIRHCYHSMATATWVCNLFSFFLLVFFSSSVSY